MKGPDSQEKFIIFTTLTERKFVKKKKKNQVGIGEDRRT